MPDVETKPLSARSTVLSLLLGAHPRGMTPAELARAGEHLGIAPATVRVALTRAVADDELRRDVVGYRLGPRLLARRRRQELHGAVVAWDGRWELAVVVATGRPAVDRAALRASLTAARLAELREGVWMRPANLARALDVDAAAGVLTLAVTDVEDPSGLVARLWDLPAWAEHAERLVDLLVASTDPPSRLAVAATLVRHLATDPLLPPALTPGGWPADAAADAYATYQRELLAVWSG